MTNVEHEIRSRVEAFVAEITALIRQAAVDAAVNALTSGGAVGGRGRVASLSKPSKKPQGRIRRTEAQIQATMAKVLSFIDSHPGSRSEEIRASTHVPAKEMADALRRLVSEKSVKTKGMRRATTYTKA